MFHIEHNITDAAGRDRLCHTGLVYGVGELRSIASELAAGDELSLADLEPVGATSESRLSGRWGELRFGPA